ncbi:MAG TPA: hypothetical protein VMN58_06615 [Acidimicrobiales bacterium]|nr:hypothetical protein [Acidimicrobiales bacterium]
MLLAELEIWHSRPNLPTRRVAVGRSLLPTEPAPGFGGLLLGGIVAANVAELHVDLSGELTRLMSDLEDGRRIPQPRLRHRLQVDRIGLARSRHRLRGHGDALELDLDDTGTPESQILGAVYAAGRLDVADRRSVMAVLRRAVRWNGPVGPALLAHLAGAGSQTWSVGAFADPERWALEVLGFAGVDSGAPRRGDVNRRFRELVRQAHPDHGGASTGAADRISELAEARRILLA